MPRRARHPRSRAAIAGLAGALVLAGCTGSPSGAATGALTATSAASAAAAPSTGSTTSAPTAASPSGSAQTAGASPAATSAAAAGGESAPVRRVDKVLVLVVENHSLGQMRAQMPYTNSLATRYGYADRYVAITHPSLPNYLAIAGGSTFGVHDDGPPSVHPVSGRSVFGDAVRAGRTARLYADAMTARCQRQSHGTYAVKHNPWAYFVAETAACRRDDVPLTAFAPDVRAGRLPTVGMVIPDLCHDAHDCALARADAFLRRYVGMVLAGPDWRSGRLAVVITADEDDSHHGNRILTVVAQPSLHGVVVHQRLDHYSLTRALAEVAGTAPLRHAATARSLLAAFRLTAG